SCNDYCEMTDYQSYFPLEIGNKWTYRTYGNWEVIGTKEINKQIYYDVLVSDEYQEHSYNIYYRFEDSKLFRYSDSDSLEILFADFSLNEDDTFHQENTGFNVTVWSDNPNGFVFYYDYPDGADEEYAVKFRIDIGILGYCSVAWEECDFMDLTDYELQ
ncbi:MAG: hypothetical protein MUP82_08410, partial [Candidatus Marinimicrobia bacterium]|nr:hypothetical protein [Candidatus Neomarinimicrobiota bacterium]